jgi:hypothetical protein
MTETASKRRLETVKLSFDYFKHLATLSSGVILIVVTFTEKMFSDPAHIKIVAQSIFPLGVAIAASLVGMSVLAFNASQDEWPKQSSYWPAWAFVMSGFGFFGGLLLVSIPLFKLYF